MPRKTDITERVLAEVPSNGEIATAVLATTLNVDSSTIRRALKKLEAEGTIEWRSRGRVARRGGVDHDTERGFAPTSAATDAGAATKTVARMIEGSETVVLDWSDFALSVAKEISSDFAGNLITNSPSIALALRHHRSATIRVIGGKLRDMRVTAEWEQLELFKAVVANPCVLGGCRVDMKHERLVVSDEDEAKVKRAMIENASSVVVPISGEDLAEGGGFIVGVLKKITHLVLQNGASAESLGRCEELGITIIQN